ncbi:MAG: hypothetical protein QOD06_2936 [Candidatus Binatota bacterium]|nr:hypothetical protein [Candidatus Binatota bacterium]
MPGAVRIGISGWRYAPWRGTFYPQGLAHRRELEFAASRFDSVEINGSFYSLQRPESYRRWCEETPPGFVFAVKGGRFITHMKRLRDVEAPLANFFASGVLRLGEKLGPILWQLPPQLAFDAERMRAFLAMLPRDTEEAARIARGHDHRLLGRAWTEADFPMPMRHAIEVRHPSFVSEELVDLLRRFGVGLVVADTARRWPLLEDVTADFVYVRLHGDEVLYVSGYGADALRDWARRIRAWRDGREPRGARRASRKPSPQRTPRDVYVYFDNDVKVRAPYDALALRALVDRRQPEESPEFEMPVNLGSGASRWPGFRR